MRYFAYGANMDPVHMAECCPGAIRLGLAVLPGHQFSIAARGYGDAVPRAGHELPGVLWELTTADAVALDRFEGVPEGWYRRDSTRVRLPDGSETDAMLYRPTDRRAGKPARGYLEGIIPVARGLGFPESYVTSLEQLRST